MTTTKNNNNDHHHHEEDVVVLGHQNNANNLGGQVEQQQQQQKQHDEKEHQQQKTYQQQHQHPTTTCTSSSEETKVPIPTPTTSTIPIPITITKRRKLRVLVITMGGERQEYITNLFQQSNMIELFHPPVFSMGVSNRLLRNRYEFFKIMNDAKLLPETEWDAIYDAYHSNNPVTKEYYEKNPERLYECLQHLPILASSNRRGSNSYDLQMHYSEEIWKKGKTINRGRAVLACTIAHLIAMNEFTSKNQNEYENGCNDYYDILLEDNIRIPNDASICSNRIWETIEAIQEMEQEKQQQQQEQAKDSDTDSGVDEDGNNATTSSSSSSSTSSKCHVRYFGWLGSISNLRWIYESHMKREQYQRKTINNMMSQQDEIQQQDEIRQQQQPEQQPTIMRIPTTQDIEKDLEVNETYWKHPISMNDIQNDPTNTTTTTSTTTTTTTRVAHLDKDDEYYEHVDSTTGVMTMERKPGGNPVWGAYAYWISHDGYEAIVHTIRNDVGTLFWKSKRMKHYLVKPIDKIIPRILLQQYGNDCIQCATQPTFFRAPMLTSKIHTKFDPEFCSSTQYQLQKIQEIIQLLQKEPKDNEKDIIGTSVSSLLSRVVISQNDNTTKKNDDYFDDSRSANMIQQQQQACHGRYWDDLWLTENEKCIVQHYYKTGIWLTQSELLTSSTTTTTTTEQTKLEYHTDNRMRKK